MENNSCFRFLAIKSIWWRHFQCQCVEKKPVLSHSIICSINKVKQPQIVNWLLNLQETRLGMPFRHCLHWVFRQVITLFPGLLPTMPIHWLRLSWTVSRRSKRYLKVGNCKEVRKKRSWAICKRIRKWRISFCPSLPGCSKRRRKSNRKSASPPCLIWITSVVIISQLWLDCRSYRTQTGHGPGIKEWTAVDL